MIFECNKICELIFCKITNSESDIVSVSGAHIVIVLLQEGGALASANGQEHPLAPQSIFMASGDVVITPAQACTMQCVGISGIAPQMARSGLTAPINTSQSNALSANIAMQGLLKAHKEGENKAQSIKAYELLCALAAFDESSAKARLPVLVSEAALFMQKKYAELYGVEELSEHLGITKNHLVREFSKSMGVTPGAYLTNIKIENAKQILLQSDYNLEITASLCGFSNANYFCKVFKKQTGVSPGQFRLKLKQENLAQSERTFELEQNIFV